VSIAQRRLPGAFASLLAVCHEVSPVEVRQPLSPTPGSIGGQAAISADQRVLGLGIAKPSICINSVIGFARRQTHSTPSIQGETVSTEKPDTIAELGK
jgi:hypothetical protein